ncbi:methyltransferase domain-containing protein [Candidatus Falkowbacteria bacterium]|nr:methyltransferase domain-containing protein [Candidatus Falkowbacteria bacterium]
MGYVFILGHNPKLSAAEVKAVLVKAAVISETGSFLIVESDEFDCRELQKRLGGTIKIGKILADHIDKDAIVDELKKLKKDNKLNFGLSYYDCPKDNLGMEIKKKLRSAGISCRLVTSKDKALSSVVVTKNKVVDFLVLGFRPASPLTPAPLPSRGEGGVGWLARTCSVQDFEAYGRRDYGRPARDMKSGSMPPKLAQIMINLAQTKPGGKILDPFCGSGTVIQEGILSGQEMVGSDISAKAVSDSKRNMEWLVANRKSQIANRYKIFQSDVKELSSKLDKVDAIVTEPYLGPPLRGSENRKQISEIREKLAELYSAAFFEFKKVLNKNGKVVMVFPSFKIGKEILEVDITQEIKKLGFAREDDGDLIYGRPGQKLWRRIFILNLLNTKEKGWR